MSLDLARKQDEDGSCSAAQMAAHYMGNWGRNQSTNTLAICMGVKTCG